MDNPKTQETNTFIQVSVLNPTPLDQELMEMPSPPADLPRPWDINRWQRYLAVLFFLILFTTWFIGKELDIAFMEIRTLGGSLVIAFGSVFFLYFYLLNRSQTLGYLKNYSARANKPLHRAIRRYRRPGADENLLQIFPRYQIGDEDYYLVWYVPGSGTVWSTSLKPGSEPLLFNSAGQWLDDHEIFNKVSLMWMHALDFAPRSLGRKKIQKAKKYQHEIKRILSPLGDILKQNQKALIEGGFENEIKLILQEYPAMLALYRNSLDTNYKIIQWADAFGWDSMTVLDYDVILDLHEKIQLRNNIKADFNERHRINKVNQAAEKLVLYLRDVDDSHRKYYQLPRLIEGLGVLTENFDPAQEEFTYRDGQWVPPEKMIKAYRSRLEFARQVDQDENG